eukprot:gnl/MRDRNA2_/MRDRNA2_78652_c0_seq1.p1 gnl/MRDRNA2_/MRDRNA2_78652_c0~~gnl/MRDRNA2_/MRDRNA2_78652_c0_seq1.p1  ORF type:complete len:382 (-),score=120.39 gnl/MRDRNA2_/MRDRNA2_78652_c0_seq1:94-1239(-)
MAEPSAELAKILKRQSLKFQDAENPPIDQTSPAKGAKVDVSPSKTQSAGYSTPKASEPAKSAGRQSLGVGAKRPQLASPAPDWDVVIKRAADLAQSLEGKSDASNVAVQLAEDLRALKIATTSGSDRLKQQDAEIAKLRGQLAAGQTGESSTEEVKDLRAALERKEKQIEASAGSVKEKERLRTELDKVEKALAGQERENEVLRRDLALSKKLQEQAQEDRLEISREMKTVTESRDRARDENQAARRAATHHSVTQLREAEQTACREVDELRARLLEAEQAEVAAQAEFELQCELAEVKGAKVAHEEMASFEASSGPSEEAAAHNDSGSSSAALGEEAPPEMPKTVGQLEDQFAFIKSEADRLEEEQKKRREEITKLLADE